MGGTTDLANPNGFCKLMGQREENSQQPLSQSNLILKVLPLLKVVSYCLGQNIAGMDLGQRAKIQLITEYGSKRKTFSPSNYM